MNCEPQLTDLASRLPAGLHSLPGRKQSVVLPAVMSMNGSIVQYSNIPTGVLVAFKSWK